METENKTVEISLVMLWNVFRRRVLYLIAALLVGAALLFCYAELFATPSYSSTAKFWVRNTSEGSASSTSSYLSGAESLASNYVQAIQGDVFLSTIADEYNLTHGETLKWTDISRMMTVTKIASTSTFTIKIESSDPDVAYDVLTVMQDKMSGYFSTNYPSDVIDVSLISRGVKDTKQDSPNVAMYTLLGGVACALIVYLIFFLQALFDTTVYDDEKLKEHFKQPVLGDVPEWRRSNESAKQMEKSRRLMKLELYGKAKNVTRDYNERLLTAETPFSVAESFKTLRTNLTYAAADGNGAPVVGVSSAFSGAGKSLVISNLAVSFAQLGKKVLLIDGDMRCPAQHKIFGLDWGHAGLSEVLAGIEKDATAACITTERYPTLDVVTSGHIPPNPSELLASERMGEFLKFAREKYEYVFIDLPPIWETTDAGVIAPLVTGYVMVVRAGYSNIKGVINGMKSMEAVNGNVLGFVVNDINPKGGSYQSSYSSYGRYKKYGRYSHYDTDNGGSAEPKQTENA